MGRQRCAGRLGGKSEFELRVCDGRDGASARCWMPGRGCLSDYGIIFGRVFVGCFCEM